MKKVLKKGRFAFNYDPKMVCRDIDFYKRFDIVVPGSFIEQEAVAEFHSRGTELFFYEWAVAFYRNETRNDDFLDDILNNHPDLLLNADNPIHHKSNNQDIFYFDFGSERLREERTTNIVKKLTNNNYDGVFFDCVGTFRKKPEEGEFVAVYNEFEKRHPEQKYHEAQQEFFRLLKTKIGPSKIFTNQGYRSPEFYVASSDYDLSESYVVTFADAKKVVINGIEHKITNFHPWNSETEPWQSTKFIIERCILKNLAKVKHQPEIMHLNYSFPVIDPKTGETKTDKEAVYYSQAAAMMFGHSAFVLCSNTDETLHHDDIYFTDLGMPISEMVELGRHAAYRKFERGIVVINGTLEELSVVVDKNKSYLDLFDQTTKKNELIISPNVQINGDITPTGRIFYDLNK